MITCSKCNLPKKPMQMTSNKSVCKLCAASKYDRPVVIDILEMFLQIENRMQHNLNVMERILCTK